MNGAPWNEQTAREIGIAWLEDELAPSSRLGRNARRRERAFAPGDEVPARAAITDVARAARELDSATIGEFVATLRTMPDLSGALALARAGDAPSDADFFELRRFVEGARALVAALDRARFEVASLARVDRSAIERVANALAPGAARDGGFYLADTFDPELATARDVAERARERTALTRSRIAARVARALGRESLASPQFIAMRDELAHGVPEGARVVSEGATYVVCELVLDDDARAALAASEAAEAAVAAREEAVRVRLGALVAANARELDDAGTHVGDFDAFLARVRFAARYDGCVPELASDGAFELRDARYLPIEASLRDIGREYVPISFDLTGIAVITGPNMGGKSVALRTAAFAIACATFGVPVPAKSANVPLVDALAWLGSRVSADVTRDEAETLLSSFGREVVEARAMLELPARRAFVVLDEFARTTSPREGRALVIALLEAVRARRWLGFLATHFADVAEPARATHYAIAGVRGSLAPDEALAKSASLDDALRRVAAAMDYRLIRVEGAHAERSDALALANALGLDREVIARAEALLATGQNL